MVSTEFNTKVEVSAYLLKRYTLIVKKVTALDQYNIIN